MNDDDDEALRFDQREGTAPELLQALRALQRESPSRARVAAVANKLGPLLDAPLPGVAPAATAVSSSSVVLVALRWLGAMFAVGTTAVWLLREPAPAPLPSVQPRASSAPVAPALAPPVVTLEQPAAAAKPSVAPPAVQLERVPPVASTRHEPARRGVAGHHASSSRGPTRRTRASRADGESPRAETARSTSGASSVAVVEPSTAIEQSARAEAAEPLASTPPATAPEEPAVAPDEPARPREKSEVELLLEARKLVKAEPRAALRLLEAHALRFPDGMLAPEREVLAIEALRATGQTAAAAQRLAAFRARDPKSAHLRRLEP